MKARHLSSAWLPALAALMLAIGCGDDGSETDVTGVGDGDGDGECGELSMCTPPMMQAQSDGGAAAVMEDDGMIVVTVMLSGEPLDGYEFCPVGDRSACQISGADGTVKFRVPANEGLWYEVDREGLFPLLWLVPAMERDFDQPQGVFVLPSAEEVLGWAEAAGVTLDTGKGLIGCSVLGGDGATASITPQSGVGPVYFRNMVPDPTATELGGLDPVQFYNVDPGQVDVALDHSERDCPGLTMPIAAGRYTWGCVMSCS